LWVDTFTTTTIVNKRINANIRSVGILNGWYIILICDIYVKFTGDLMLKDLEIMVNEIIEDISTPSISMTGRVWLGVIATKYENITNMPPI